jgi:hypothetical protein
MVQVEQIDGDGPFVNAGRHGSLQLIGLIAQRTLPERDVVRSNPQGTCLLSKVLQRPPGVAALQLPGEGLPCLNDGHAVPDVPTSMAR